MLNDNININIFNYIGVQQTDKYTYTVQFNSTETISNQGINHYIYSYHCRAVKPRPVSRLRQTRGLMI